MKVYQTIDGTLIGFYQERGAVIQALIYRDKYEMQLVDKERIEEKTVPGYEEIYEIIEPGYFEEKRVYVQGHYEILPFWFEEYSITKYREVPGHFEIKPHWFEEYSVTRYRTVPGFWEAYERDIPPRGVYPETEPPYTWYRWIEEHVEEYQEVIPAGFKDTRVWVETTYEPYQEIMPAGYKDTRVWVDGAFVTEDVWHPEAIRIEKVWIEAKTEFITVKYQKLEEVWVGREPVYEYVDPVFVAGFDILELVPAPAGVAGAEDAITIRNTETGEVLSTTAYYIGLAEKIDDNEFVVP